MFENVVSLGANCLIASALGKYGLRSVSGPFDWCTSNFMQGVIPHIEQDFSEFMLYENLEVSYREKTFDDTKYKINYNHDVKTSLEMDYEQIISKYHRRIEKFREMVKNPTCFVRGCWSMEELSSIIGNEDRISEALNLNNGNELVFVVPQYIYNQNPIETRFKLFTVDTNISGFALGREESRSFFDTNMELVDFLIKNYPESKRKDNLIFDLQAEILAAKKFNVDSRIDALKDQIKKEHEENVALSTRLALWMRVENSDYTSLSRSENIVIYGCGAIGRTFAKK